MCVCRISENGLDNKRGNEKEREREKGERNGGKTKINLSIVMKKEKGNFVEKCDGYAGNEYRE